MSDMLQLVVAQQDEPPWSAVTCYRFVIASLGNTVFVTLVLKTSCTKAVTSYRTPRRLSHDKLKHIGHSVSQEPTLQNTSGIYGEVVVNQLIIQFTAFPGFKVRAERHSTTFNK